MLSPASDVTATEYELLKISTLIMTLIGAPIILGIVWIVLRFRDRKGHAGYDPSFDESPLISNVTFYVPLLTIVTLGALTWIYTHRLDPYRPRPDPASLPPYEIQAVSLDYKWLFIHPEAGVASVNELVAPAGRSVTIRLTSDPMMTSIFMPALVSQIYAMTGMETRANFMAPQPGEYDGANAMYSGPEFYKQRFKVRLLAKDDFAAWVRSVAGGQAPGTDIKRETTLDFARYLKLAERTPGYPVTAFARVEPRLFEKIVRQFSPAYRMNPLPSAAGKSERHGDRGTATHEGM